ncbi:MAG: SRPBCC family protein [Betaproteobacteria bacterium]
MFITAETGITINSTPEAVWDYASDPANWTASNSEEHFGLAYYNSRDNRPATGVEFHQRESVAGVYADLRGRFLHVERPRIAVWTGTAVYRLLGGLIHIRIPEGGVVKAERSPAGTRLSHDVYMDFPNSWWGRLLVWIFRNVFKGPDAAYNHTYKELVFFKEQLEKKQPAPKKKEGVVPSLRRSA